ncbi:cobaltochelatase subunit CobN [Granulosicoccus antarcticus]|uniref:Cobaltochelatase subunit CobN n=1 Tax=Granulosicoccus antarcticus IMCC3135 TaxID=1192854 RepID=A0A2Z2NL01_9GAMM|nr:cobaltochelatase subunit CobN [Granulosicoccus antarcticus]ASJ71829.1 Aerobic cobaltochelatase subunit CobN [Granulosicoccus antarcticus IMCC3135]
MHLLSSQPGAWVEDASIITRIDQEPGELIILSAADTTLALLSAAHPLACHEHGAADYPVVRLTNQMYLRQPASVDLYIDQILQFAKVIVIDLLGGEGYWPYAVDRIVELCESRSIALIMFSGDNTEDGNLLMKSTVDMPLCRQLWRYLREGGVENARNFYRLLGNQFFSQTAPIQPPRVLPALSILPPPQTEASVQHWEDVWIPGAACVAILFYRAHLQSGNVSVFLELCKSLQSQGLNPLPLALASLKDAECMEGMASLCEQHEVALILNTTAFSQSSMDDPGDHALLGDVPVLQVILSGGNQEGWEADTQGLSPRDIAMHVALPEVDGRIITRAVSFKGLERRCEYTQCDIVGYQAHGERLDFVARLAQRWCRLRVLPTADKRLALILANYPTREGRLGNGVGLDTPASVVNILRRLQQDGYGVDELPQTGQALMEQLKEGITNDPAQWALRPARQSLALADYLAFFDTLPEVNRTALIDRWGLPEQDPMLRQGRFMIAGLRCGKVFVGIQPARGYELDHMASYHDPDLIPPHHYLAFYAWIREHWQSDAIVHVGKHGSLEWLPGKSIALSEQCWPDLILGPMPHLYPFIVNDPGEGSQAKRRAQAVIIDHLMPPLTRAENYGPLRDLERLIDEYYEALQLDYRRAELLRTQVLAHIVEHDLHQDVNLCVPDDAQQEQALLTSIDAYLCELKESQIRDGLHIFGESPTGRLRRDTLLALARYPVANGEGGDESLIRALVFDLQLGASFDPLVADDWGLVWQGARPAVLEECTSDPWRTRGDTRERLEMLATQLIEADCQEPGESEHGKTDSLLQADWVRTSAVMSRLRLRLKPSLDACGEQELLQLGRGLNGRFVPAGPSGAPSRGRPDVLPTGRNFYSVDTRAIPTMTSFGLGERSAAQLLVRYLQDHGDYPRAIGLSVWGTATMRTGGDDISQAFALIGVRPKWADGSHRVCGFEVLPMSVVDRPRIDVTLRVSGFFRDAFASVMRLFDAAVQAVAELDEPASVNPIRERVMRETAELVAQGLTQDEARTQAGHRVFGAQPGSYGAGLQGLIDQKNWTDDADLAKAYLNWGGYAYGQNDHGTDVRDTFARRLSSLELVMHNQDNREHDILDSDDYYQFHGGMTAAVRHLSGQQPSVMFGDHSNPMSPAIRTLDEEISRVVRSRVTNPKWIDGVKRHGYKGAFEMAATVDYLFAYDATARVVRDDQYARVTDAYVEDDDTRQFLQQYNPDALYEICERLLEAMERGLWQQPGDYRQSIERHLLAAEQQLEGGGASKAVTRDMQDAGSSE